MRILFLFALFFAFQACEQANVPSSEQPLEADIESPEDKAAAQQLIQDIFDHVWSGTDTSFVARYQTKDFVLLEHGEIWTNDTIRNYQLRSAASKKSDASQRKNSFDFFRTEQNGDEIWLAYHNYGHWVDAAGDTTFSMRWLESAVAKRYEDGWKLRMMHSTRMPFSESH